MSKATAYNKGIAAAGVTVAAWVASMFGLDVPAEIQGALITLAVVFIPNR